MKVSTDLKAGGWLQDATSIANQAAGKLEAYLGKASQQAEKLTSDVIYSSTTLWNCLYKSFGKK